MNRWGESIFAWPRRTILAIAVTLLGTSLSTLSICTLPVQANSAAPNPIARPGTDWLVADSRSILALAKHLKQVGAKMYGAYWCPHCKHQQELFGSSAFGNINYIECDPKGENARPKLCRDAKISGYPTWEINGKFYPGVQSLEELAKRSGYKGSNKF